MSKKIKVGIICGGISAEHEISLLSAKSVIASLNPNLYEVHIFGIQKTGVWNYYQSSGQWLLHAESPKNISLAKSDYVAIPCPWQSKKPILLLDDQNKLVTNLALTIDVFFPVIHGPRGEDGTLQGLLTLMDTPFVGAGVLGSAVGMDKEVMKHLLIQHNLPVGHFKVLYNKLPYQELVSELGESFYLKPANMGSSVGVSKVESESAYNEAIKLAFKFDTKILAETTINAREIECSVLGNELPKASLPGELVTKHTFYSYEAKYLDNNGTDFSIPAKLDTDLVGRFQKLAVETYKALSCEGFARVDFFLTKENEIFVNEINTIPGFTSVSMYPKMWEASGLPYGELVDTLISLAFERFEKQKILQKTF
jgi:D-alanine-D-alanine ligase